MTAKTIHATPHRRYNPLSDKWVLVSPHRADRPWHGKVERPNDPPQSSHDENCYLCAGNTRASGKVNENYTGCFVFDNDFAALQENELNETFTDGLMHASSVSGECKVLCYSPDHSKTMPELDVAEIEQVIDAWCDLYNELEEKYQWVQIFENKGEINGCSNPHPHGQVWASGHIPDELGREATQQKAYFDQHKRPLLLDYLEQEIENKQRIVCLNDDWVALVPYWASWPFETILLPRSHKPHMNDLNDGQKRSLAEILKQLTTRYDNLFKTPFPYSMGWHSRPANGDAADPWQLHAHFYPPLLRSATVQKFMVGYELMAEIQRDISPESAAKMLRDVSKTHYKMAL